MAEHIALKQIQALRHKPVYIGAPNGNDVRRLIYDVFAHFSHLAPADWFLKHFDPDDMHLDFGSIQIKTHNAFRAWYADWLAHCPWEYHEIAGIEIAGDAAAGFHAQFLLHHTGEWHGGPGKINAAMTEDGPFNRLLRETWRLKVIQDDLKITYYGVDPIVF